jgi:hypothetical protein
MIDQISSTTYLKMSMFVVKTANFIPSLMMGLYSQNRLILGNWRNRYIVNTKNQKDSLNTACDSDATDAFDYGF